MSVSALPLIRPGAIVTGPIFPERIRIEHTVPMSNFIKLIGKALSSTRFYGPVLTLRTTRLAVVSPELEPFDGNPDNFRLGLAHEYAPYFSL